MTGRTQRFNRPPARKHFLYFLRRFTFAPTRTDSTEAARTRQGILRHSPQRTSGYNTDPHSTSSPWSQQVLLSQLLFYHITCTHTHRRIIQIQHVDLYDVYLLIISYRNHFVKWHPYTAICLKYARGFVFPVTRQ